VAAKNEAKFDPLAFVQVDEGLTLVIDREVLHGENH